MEFLEDPEDDDTVDAEFYFVMITNALISTEYEAFTARLFARPPGTWQDVEALSQGLSKASKEFAGLRELYNGPVSVLWMPFDETGEDYMNSVVFFFVKDPIWSLTAIFHNPNL
jgi:hypothetical protein